MVRTRRSAAADELITAPPQLEPVSSVKRPVTRRSRISTNNAETASAGSSATPTPTTYSSGSDYTTPLTSNVATPVPEASKSQPALGNRSSYIEVRLPSSRALPRTAPGRSIYAMTTKRKRDMDDSEEDYSDNEPDAKLARRLQAEADAKEQAGAALTMPHGSSSESDSGFAPTRRGVGRAVKRAPFIPGLTGRKELRLATPPNKTPAKQPSRAAIKRTAVIPDSQDDDDSPLSDPPEESDDSDDSLRDLPRRPSKRGAGRLAAILQPDEDTSVQDDDSDFSLNDGVSLPQTTGPDAASEMFDDDEDEPLISRGIHRATNQRRAYRAYRSSRRTKNDRSRLEKQHPVLKTMWKKLEDMPVLKACKADQPTSISRQLKPFQLEGLAWMKEMEKTEWQGGLLGDEMGLGKTIQAVSLIMSDFPAKKPTLVLVPPVALMQWMTEIESYTDGTLKTLVLHGTNSKAKNLTTKDVKKYHVIIMSYNSLESMYRKQEKGFKRKDGLFKEESVMHRTEFHRVILDEAHSIKSRTTMTAKACFALKVTYRWCLSGTPLQNRIGEFFSLIRFLNVQPFSSYLCKQCPCSKLEWAMDDNNNCTKCHHSGMQHVSVFNQEILNPIQKYGNSGAGAEGFQKLRILTDRIMLRRLKKDHTDSMELPVKEINVERQFFGEEENDFANSIMTSGQRKFDTYVASGVLLNNYANIFGLIMQMRQVADHPDLILRKHSEGGQNILVCGICDEPAEDAIRSRCKHDFCRVCVKSYLNSSESPNCPVCHIGLNVDLEQPEIEQDEVQVKKSSIINRIKMENWTSSSKIELLVHELHKLRSDNASHKSIIFSQFTTMLQLLEWRLRRAGITTVMLDGSMSPAQRQASIKHFMENPDVECFLVSLKAGGVALNLTEASRVFIVDPWWNPAAEWQSADRCHRIGQTRPCTITRLCIEDSVESRMVLLQEKKTNMINSTINSDDAAMDSLSPEDLQFLFRGS